MNKIFYLSLIVISTLISCGDYEVMKEKNAMVEMKQIGKEFRYRDPSYIMPHNEDEFYPKIMSERVVWVYPKGKAISLVIRDRDPIAITPVGFFEDGHSLLLYSDESIVKVDKDVATKIIAKGNRGPSNQAKLAQETNLE